MARLEQRTTKEGKPLKNEWHIWIELPKRHPGDRRRKKSQFTGSKSAAEVEMRRLQALADAGKLQAGKETVGQIFDRYLEEHVKTRLAPHTYVAYKTALTVHGGRLRGIPLTKLQRHHLTEHEAYLTTDARDRRVSGRKSNLAPTTVARYLNPVKSALEWAESVELLARNPARYWKIPQTQPPERPHFDRDQAQRFIAAVAGSPWAPHLLTLASTGVRLSELRGLRWQDVDLETGSYQVHQQWQTVMVQTPAADGSLHWKATDVRRPAPKSTAGVRGGGIPLAVCAVLKTWRVRQKEARLAAGRRWKDAEGGALVFADDTGRPFSSGTLRTHFYRLCSRNDLPRLSLHDLRGTWVTLQLEAGTAEYLVPQLAGHSPKVDRMVYRHTTAKAGVEAAARLWDFITPPELDASRGGREGGGGLR